MSAATPVVLLHPLGVDHTVWRDVVAALEREPGTGPVVALDLPGHGTARMPAAGSGAEELATHVEAELERRGLAPAHLVGVSLGGLLAQVVAARSPHLVERLVLVDTVAVYPDAMRTMWAERAAVARSEGLEPLLGPTESLWFTEGYRAEGRAGDFRSTFLATDPEGYARSCEALATADTTGLVGGITAPTLVACGYDDAPPFRDAALWFSKRVDDAELAWLDGRHAAALEQPEAFARLLREFLT